MYKFSCLISKTQSLKEILIFKNNPEYFCGQGIVSKTCPLAGYNDFLSHVLSFSINPESATPLIDRPSLG